MFSGCPWVFHRFRSRFLVFAWDPCVVDNDFVLLGMIFNSDVSTFTEKNTQNHFQKWKPFPIPKPKGILLFLGESILLSLLFYHD